MKPSVLVKKMGKGLFKDVEENPFPTCTPTHILVDSCLQNGESDKEILEGMLGHLPKKQAKLWLKEGKKLYSLNSKKGKKQ